MTKTIWTISELAEEFKITARTLRFYEQHAILSPDREGQKRLYSQRDRTRLKLALRGKRLGFTLSEICTLINMYEGPGSTETQLNTYLSVLNLHKEQLMQQKTDLELVLEELSHQEQHCQTLLQNLLARKNTASTFDLKASLTQTGLKPR